MTSTPRRRRLRLDGLRGCTAGRCGSAPVRRVVRRRARWRTWWRARSRRGAPRRTGARNFSFSPVAVDVGGVEERDAQFQGALQGGAGLVGVGRAVGALMPMQPRPWTPTSGPPVPSSCRRDRSVARSCHQALSDARRGRPRRSRSCSRGRRGCPGVRRSAARTSSAGRLQQLLRARRRCGRPSRTSSA